MHRIIQIKVPALCPGPTRHRLQLNGRRIRTASVVVKIELVAQGRSGTHSGRGARARKRRCSWLFAIPRQLSFLHLRRFRAGRRGFDMRRSKSRGADLFHQVRFVRSLLHCGREQLIKTGGTNYRRLVEMADEGCFSKGAAPLRYRAGSATSSACWPAIATSDQ